MRWNGLLVLLGLSACTHWARTESPIQVLTPAARKPEALVRLTLQDGRRVVFYQPELRGNTLVGLATAQGREWSGYPVAQIRRLEFRRFDLLGTAGGASAALVLGALVAARADGTMDVNIPCGLLGEPCRPN